MTSGLNVLLIVVDQWRAEALGCMGARHALTPNLDRLAARGRLFGKHFAQGTPCAPARASLLTGRYVMNHRVVTNGVPLGAGHTHLARELRNAGYEPTLIGYTTTTPDPALVARTDARFKKMGDIPSEWRVAAHFEYGDYPEYLSWVHQRNPRYRSLKATEMWQANPPSERPTDAPTLIEQDLSDTRWVTDHALDFLDEKRQEPWVLHLGYFRPHPPFTAPAPYNTLVDPATIPLPRRASTPAAECNGHPVVSGYINGMPLSHFLEGGVGGVVDLTDAEVRSLRRAYYGLVAEVDAELGRVIDRLSETGQLERTLIVFTSDHGEQLGDHYLFGKVCWYDESYHIPLIVVDPRTEFDTRRGIRADTFSESVDVMPTILDLLGLPIPPAIDGRSLRPLLNGKIDTVRAAVHYEFSLRRGFPSAGSQMMGIDWRDADVAVIRTDRHKYVHFQTLPPILFDLEQDPWELNNVAESPEYRDVALDLARQMLTWRMRHADSSLSRFNTSPGGLLDFAADSRAGSQP